MIGRFWSQAHTASPSARSRSAVGIDPRVGAADRLHADGEAEHRHHAPGDQREHAVATAFAPAFLAVLRKEARPLPRARRFELLRQTRQELLAVREVPTVVEDDVHPVRDLDLLVRWADV